MKSFWDFVTERQAIWHRREVLKMPKPWTDDFILQTRHFANIFRELDPGTLVAYGIMKHDATFDSRLWNLRLYRILNREETWVAMGGFQLDRSEAFRRLLELERRGPVFTMMTQINSFNWAHGKTAIERMRSVMLDYDAAAWGARLDSAGSLREAVWATMEVRTGVREFLGYHMCLDLRMWNDDIWAPVMRGCLAGLKLVCGAADLNRLIELRDQQPREFKKYVPAGLKRMRLCHVENALCEYHRYVSGGRGIRYSGLEDIL